MIWPLAQIDRADSRLHSEPESGSDFKRSALGRRRRPLLLAWPLLLSLVALAGCEGGTMVPRWNQPGLLTAFLAAARQGPVAVAVAGNPSDQPQAAFEAWVVEALGRGNSYPGTRLAVQTTDELPQYRFVIAFDPGLGVGAEALCQQGRRTPTRPMPGKPTIMLATFCGPLRPMSEVEGALPAGLGDRPAAERFLARSFLFMVLPEDSPPQFSRGDL